MSDRTITFTSAGSGLANFKFVLESAENSGRTVFAPGDRARLKLYPGGRNPELRPTSGTAKVIMSGITEEVTEFIAFRDSADAKTDYYIDKLISAVWEGTGSGRPKIYGSRLVLPESTTGVMKVTYETSCDIVDVTGSRATYILVTASSDGLEGDFLLDFTNGFTTEIYSRDVVMTVRDACTKETLPDAAVYINGRYTGKSDSEGVLRLGSLKKGTYSLKITKSGYQSTDQDNIRNDWFTVE
jgi:hypothetical protein